MELNTASWMGELLRVGLTFGEYTSAVERHVANPDDSHRIGRSQGCAEVRRQVCEIRVTVVPGK